MTTTPPSPAPGEPRLRGEIIGILNEMVAGAHLLPDQDYVARLQRQREQLLTIIDRERRAAVEEAFQRLQFPAVVLRCGDGEETVIPENEKKRILSEMFPSPM